MKIGFLKRNALTIALFVFVLAVSHTQIAQAVDSIIDGNIVFTGPGQGGAKDIRTSNTEGGLRIYNGTDLSPIPTGAAIQFFGNGSASFPGQAYIDSGANNNAAIVLRTAPTSGGITERMRIGALGNIALGTGAQASVGNGIAFGDGALASRFGEKAFANGTFGVPGEAQYSTFILRGVVPTNSLLPVELTLDNLGSRITVPQDHAITFGVQGTILGSSGNAAMFNCGLLAKRIGATTSIATTPFPCSVSTNDPFSPVAAINVDDGTDSLTVTVNIISVTESYRVSAVVQSAQVGFPLP